MTIQRFVVDKILRLQVKRRMRRQPDVILLRPMMQEMAKRNRPPPADVKVATVDLGGVPAELLQPDGAREDAAIFYIHGGGWVGGDPKTYRPMLWRLAKAASVPLYAIDYRLAPEHPFPAALEDATAGYSALIKRVDPKRVVVGGDSAGGNLALSLMLNLKAKGIALPGGLMCLSPATDLNAHGGSLVSNGESDALFVPEMIDSAHRHYCAGHPLTDPLISPLRGDLAGLPPTLIHCAQLEMLRDQSIDLAKALTAAGVDAKIEVWPKVWHVWHLSADVLPEARGAIAKLAAFARQSIG